MYQVPSDHDFAVICTLPYDVLSLDGGGGLFTCFYMYRTILFDVFVLFCPLERTQ